ncbi:hypothetical protein C8A05DRAFT_39214 [Staphylotrichum tortipilum]|uniref:Cell wall protein PhiA n=1 Tax=Staphylotrichum tortipilum TaxID=2831512 RepID=A0AAN6MAC1_9PEZI|nr:hypothetical protein C8A05DRAFT_39214 [Staphylotrichum longicolle]
MQLTTVLLSLFAAAATAAPAGASCPAPVRKFGIMSLRSASPVHFGQVSATQNKMVLNLPENKRDAVCTDGKTHENAVFYIRDGELFLYGKEKTQEFFTDRSGMGQGVLQYFNKGETGLGNRFEVKGWAVDENDNLTFNGAGLLACPSKTDGSWYIWVSVGNDKPAGQEGCLGFSARTITIDKPVKCTYSIYSP